MVALVSWEKQDYVQEQFIRKLGQVHPSCVRISGSYDVFVGQDGQEPKEPARRKNYFELCGDARASFRKGCAGSSFLRDYTSFSLLLLATEHPRYCGRHT